MEVRTGKEAETEKTNDGREVLEVLRTSWSVTPGGIDAKTL